MTTFRQKLKEQTDMMNTKKEEVFSLAKSRSLEDIDKALKIIREVEKLNRQFEKDNKEEIKQIKKLCRMKDNDIKNKEPRKQNNFLRKMLADDKFQLSLSQGMIHFMEKSGQLKTNTSDEQIEEEFKEIKRTLFNGEELDQIDLIKEIGKRGRCTEEEIKRLLPEFPFLRGSEYLFKINHANAKKYIDNEVELLVKGLHLIELKYIELTGNNFGFGSPSPTSKVINALEVKNEPLARNLRAWVIENGGNYYDSEK